MTDWHEVHDSREAKPAALDTTSSAAMVYERRNIRRETLEDTQGGDTRAVTEWVYDQREYTREEYAAMTSPATQAIMQAVSGLELSVAELSLGMTE